jgi:hypothetical protein
LTPNAIKKLLQLSVEVRRRTGGLAAGCQAHE